MKKYIYLCCLMFLSMNMMAQIDLNDGWEVVLDEQFTGMGRGWNSRFIEQRPSWIPADSAWSPKWRVNAIESTDGVTKKDHYHAYQPCCTLFNSEMLHDNKMRLTAKRVSETPLACDESYPTGYELPHPEWHQCDTSRTDPVFYYSGNIQSFDQTYHYGYYEIECSLPVHPGIHTSFWLFGGAKDTITGLKYYEEIDIMEYSKADCDEDPYYGHSSGIWYDRKNICDTFTLTHYDFTKYHMPIAEPDIRQMHTYACEWMPDHVIFYRDGRVIHECRDLDHIPQYPKYIKTGYAINRSAIKTIQDTILKPDWRGPDTITINYIKAYQLCTDCGTDEYIQTAQQLNQTNRMKRSITISNPSGIVLQSSTNKTLRATDYILIEGPFEIASGAQLTLMVHECPEYDNRDFIQFNDP